MTVYTNTTVELYSSELKETISVGPYEIPGIISVKSSSNDAWGDMDFTVDLETATALANALLKQVAFMQEAEE